MEWISIEDGLPEAGFDVLLVKIRNSDLSAMAVFVGETIEGYWKVQPLFGNWYATNDEVTHWMPLPEAQKKPYLWVEEDGPDRPTIHITIDIPGDAKKLTLDELESCIYHIVEKAMGEMRRGKKGK